MLIILLETLAELNDSGVDLAEEVKGSERRELDVTYSFYHQRSLSHDNYYSEQGYFLCGYKRYRKIGQR